jgi:starvation-inducible DNA-binding protein
MRLWQRIGIGLILLLCCSGWGMNNAVAQNLPTPPISERIPISQPAREPTAKALQASLVELLDLELVTKQAHWNVNGALFYSLHRLLDDFVADYRTYADLVAERELAVGKTADGRPQTVSSTANLPTFPPGYLSDGQVIDTLSLRLNEVAQRLRTRIQQLDEVDLVSQDILIEVERGIAEHLWMLREFQRQ